jgi:hypothetical protein
MYPYKQEAKDKMTTKTEIGQIESEPRNASSLSMWKKQGTVLP